MIRTKLLTIFMVAAVVLPASGGPVPSELTNAEDGVVNFLRKFGFINSQGFAFSVPDVAEALRTFQRSAGVRETGKVDLATEALIQTPRCGARDMSFRTTNAGWQYTDLSYRIESYPDPVQLPPYLVDDVVYRAFQFWAKVSPLTFTQKDTGIVDIVIVFGSGSHGDRFPFDGRGGTLGHAFEPDVGATSPREGLYGDAHFDSAELWTFDSEDGTNILQVLVHEFGHSLGLSHSNIRTAAMYAFLGGYDDNFQLDMDDIEGIQSLYGPPEGMSSLAPMIKTTTTQRTGREITPTVTEPSTTTRRGGGGNNRTPTTASSLAPIISTSSTRRRRRTRNTRGATISTTPSTTTTSRTPRTSDCSIDFIKYSNMRRKGAKRMRNISTFQQCRRTCVRSVTCFAFSYNNVRREDARCFIHNLKVVYSKKTDFYLKTYRKQDASTSYEAVPFTKHKGGIRDKVSKQECQDMCDFEQHCIGFTYRTVTRDRQRWWCRLHIYAQSAKPRKMDHYVKACSVNSISVDPFRN